MQMAQFLVESGANTEIKDGKNHTPLQIATWRGHLEVEHFLSISKDKGELSNNSGFWISFALN